MRNLSLAIFLEALYQKKFKQVLTRAEMVEMFTDPGGKSAFFAALGISEEKPKVYEARRIINCPCCNNPHFV